MKISPFTKQDFFYFCTRKAERVIYCKNHLFFSVILCIF